MKVKSVSTSGWVRSLAVALVSAVALLAFTPAAPAAPQGPWVLPASDLSAAGQNAERPQTAIAPDGTTTVVWERHDGANYVVQAATRPRAAPSALRSTSRPPARTPTTPRSRSPPTAPPLWSGLATTAPTTWSGPPPARRAAPSALRSTSRPPTTAPPALRSQSPPTEPPRWPGTPTPAWARHQGRDPPAGRLLRRCG